MPSIVYMVWLLWCEVHRWFGINRTETSWVWRLSLALHVTSTSQMRLPLFRTAFLLSMHFTLGQVTRSAHRRMDSSSISAFLISNITRTDGSAVHAISFFPISLILHQSKRGVDGYPAAGCLFPGQGLLCRPS